MDYSAFVDGKSNSAPVVGFNPDGVSDRLFPFQRDIVTWALRRGRAAIFADCGMGKTPMQLEWAHRVASHTGGRVLILAPLAVATQTVREAAKFGITAEYRRAPGGDCPIVVTNYEMLHLFDAADFAGIVLDESSILKAFDGKTRTQIIETFRATPYRLACTATPAPNDFMELGNHAEFLGVMTRAEMLSMYFVHDGGTTQDWRLKGHAEDAFWRWVCEWAVMVRKPSDLGYDDGSFILPALTIEEHIVSVDHTTAHAGGMLFKMEAVTLDEQRGARRATIESRVATAARLVESTPGPWLIWCELNAEGDALTAAIPGAVQVAGADDADFKIAAIEWFTGSRCICRPRKNEKPTIVSGLSETASTSESIEQRQETSETPIVARSMQPTRKDESRHGRSLGSGSLKTQTSDLSSDYDHSESPQQNIAPCFSHRAEGVQSAAGLVLGTRVEAVSQSITVTQRASSVGCFASIATTDSANSPTTLTGSSAPSCTCGALGKSKVLISKPSMFGMGLNLQHCANVAFVGLSHSYEQFYQAVRRCWRFGQTRPVTAHIIIAETEGRVAANLRRKEQDAARMAAAMVGHMRDIQEANIHGTGRVFTAYRADRGMTLPQWIIESAQEEAA